MDSVYIIHQNLSFCKCFVLLSHVSIVYILGCAARISRFVLQLDQERNIAGQMPQMRQSAFTVHAVRVGNTVLPKFSGLKKFARSVAVDSLRIGKCHYAIYRFF